MDVSHKDLVGGPLSGQRRPLPVPMDPPHRVRDIRFLLAPDADGKPPKVRHVYQWGGEWFVYTGDVEVGK